MKQKKNAFTLIELLAVIVILAIIALIAVPTVMNIINKANKSAFKDSAYGIIKAGELYYTKQLLEPNGMIEEVSFDLSDVNEGLEINGEVPEGEMRINKEGDIALAITNGKYCARKDYKEQDVTIDEVVEECSFYKEDLLNGTDPALKEGLIPVTIDAGGVVRKASITRKWYSYEEKVWANAITVKEEVRNKYETSSAGTVIKEEDILTYFVWIPRYKYRLWNVENMETTGVDASIAHSINIIFENNETKKSDGKCEETFEKEANGCFLTHPAFTFGNDELNGIWVGKFETGYSGAVTQADAEIDEVNANKLIIKPNVYAWNAITVSNAFYNAMGMNDKGNIFGLLEDSDTHVMKNIEWGAVTYLSHSEYGTCIDGVCTDVYANRNKNCITGCGSNSFYSNPSANCLNGFGTKTDGIYNQSTNNNISGIFDMVGGSGEVVMGVMKERYGESDFTVENFPETKYVDIYEAYNSMWYYENRILGDATGELGPFSGRSSYAQSSWVGDSVTIYFSLPWYFRGGNYVGTATIFGFRPSLGDKVSFRLVIS